MKHRSGSMGVWAALIGTSWLWAGTAFARGGAADDAAGQGGQRATARQRNRTEERQGNRAHGMEQRRARQGEEGQGGACREQAQTQRRAHMEKMRAENETFRQGLREQEPAAALAAIIAHRQRQFQANQAFMRAMHEQRLTCLRKLAGEKADGERLAEKLAQYEKAFAEMLARHQERHNELIARLTALQGKTDLTWDDLREAKREGMRERTQRQKREKTGERARDRKRPRGNNGNGAGEAALTL